MNKIKQYTVRTILVIMALFVTVSATGCTSTPDGGVTQVVRNGGPFDNHNIRQIIHNGEGNTWTGWFSEVRDYPSSDSERIYKFDNGDGADAGPVQVPSRDGVQMTLVGTFYLNTAFDGTKEGDALLKSFDTKYGNREFDGAKVYDLDDGGFSKWLNVAVKPTIDSSIRETIAQFDCKALVPSCALIQNGNGRVDVSAATSKDGKSNTTIVQDRLNKKVAEDIKSKLGGEFFKNIRFSLGAVQPEERVRAAIAEAQSAFASISKSDASVKAAKADAQANRERQKGYNDCSVCGKIDTIKALPRGLTALGGNIAVGIGK